MYLYCQLGTRVPVTYSCILRKEGALPIKTKELLVLSKEFFRTCNGLPFSCTHLALWRGYKGKLKDPRYMQNKKDSRISLALNYF